MSPTKYIFSVNITTIFPLVIGTQPVMLNISNASTTTMSSGGGVQNIVNTGISPGKQASSKASNTNSKKSPGLKVKLPTQTLATNQVVTLPSDSTAKTQPTNEMAMAIPGPR